MLPHAQVVAAEVQLQHARRRIEELEAERGAAAGAAEEDGGAADWEDDGADNARFRDALAEVQQ